MTGGAPAPKESGDITAPAIATMPETRIDLERPITGTLAVDDFDATVQTPGALILTHRHRTLFAVAHDFDLRSGNVIERQEGTHRVGTTLAQTHVVLARTALVRMTFEYYAHVTVGGQILGVSLHDRPLVSQNLGAIE